MSFEDDLRATLDSAGRSAPPPPGDLKNVIRRGRRRRALTYAGSTFAVVLAVGAITLTVQSFGNGASNVSAGDDVTTTVGERSAATTIAPQSADDFDAASETAPPPTSDAATTVTTAPPVAGSDGTTTTTVATAPVEDPFTVFRSDYEAEAYAAAEFYVDGRARRVMLTNPLAVVDLPDRRFMDVVDAPFARVSYGVVLPDGSMLAQELDDSLGTTLWLRSPEGAWSPLPPVSDFPTLLAGYYGSDDGTVDLYFIESPLEEAVSFEDAGTIALEYDYDNQSFLDLWRRADVSGTRYSPNPTGELLLVEDQGVDPVYGPAYFMLDAATGTPRADGDVYRPQGVFEDSGNASVPDSPLRTPDHAAFISEVEYAYIETNWGDESSFFLRQWVVGSTETPKVRNAVEVFEFGAAFPVDGYELFACRFLNYSITGNAFIDLETSFVTEFYDDGSEPGPPFPSC